MSGASDDTKHTWHCLGKERGIVVWRMRLAVPFGKRKHVHVRDFGTEAHAVTETGYIRRFDDVDSAKRYLESCAP